MANCRKCGYAPADCDLIAEHNIKFGHKKVCPGYEERQIIKKAHEDRDKQQLELAKGSTKGPGRP